MDILELARDSGLTMLLDGKIGRQEYTSVSGSLDALQLFAQMIRAASLDEFRRSRRSSARPIGEKAMIAKMAERARHSHLGRCAAKHDLSDLVEKPAAMHCEGSEIALFRRRFACSPDALSTDHSGPRA